MSEFARLIAVGVVALALTGGFALYAANAKSPFNIPFKTLGGKQFWSDVHHLAGWRIQRHVWTQRHRLLDQNNVRRAWGDEAHCREVLDGWQKRLGLQPQSDHLVILLHGIGRSTGTFSRLVGPLKQEGYEVANVSYASTRRPLEAHAETLSSLISGLRGIKTVSFVTHSMGGLVLRQLLSERRDWQDRISIHRIVQIAPPNQGSVVARMLKDVWPYQWLYGPAGQQLTPASVQSLPPLTAEFGIIAGGTGNRYGLNPWIGGDNDGTVRVGETDLPGARDTVRINAFHLIISNKPDSVRAVLNFLKRGVFSEPAPPNATTKSDRHA